MRILLTLSLCCVPMLHGQSVQLATSYEGEVVSAYLVSEKLDGIRAIWDGEVLYTRRGNPISAPLWFTENWPHVWLDGELWAGRGGFNDVQKTVLDTYPDHAAWRTITYQVFDAPNDNDVFEQRYQTYLQLVQKTQQPYLKAVQQHELVSTEALYQYLDSVVEQGGEGVMLHRKDALFHDGRSDALLKLKRFRDAEAKVVGYVAGRGKYTGVLGALKVELANGRQFKIGTGFSDQERSEPPVIGEYITFRYHGFTATGLPRFASFIRVRKDPFEFRDPD